MRVSVVIPTMNEGANAVELLQRLGAVLGPDDEVIFVDDGIDELPAIVDAAAIRHQQRFLVHRRTEPTGGLGGAVTLGFRLAAGDVLVVCDGDLQHPPEVIPDLLSELDRADLVVASRYRDGGSAEGLDGGWRRLASRATGYVSRALFPLKLRGCSDPMSGFFAVRRSAFVVADLRPKGFKILLELLVRSSQLRLAEVPFVFAEREAGTSHATYREGMRFLRQLIQARVLNRAAAFMLVGLSGVVPNLVLVWLLTDRGVHYIAAAAMATQAAIVWNFAGAELLVWRDQRLGDWKRRFVKFVLIGETDLARLPFVIVLVSYLHVTSLVATGITLAGAFACRFTLADKLVYRRAAPLAAPDPALLLTTPETAPPTAPENKEIAAATTV